jgi:leucyl aminopeptidase (aminopeptidase T)
MDNNLELMVKGAKNALGTILKMQPEEPLLIITDESSLSIAQAFREGGSQLEGIVKMYQLSENQRPLKELPEDLPKYIEHCREGGIIVNLIEAKSSETPFRIKLIRTELGTKARVGHAPGITINMMTEGPMCADYLKIAEKVTYLIDLFKNARSVKITAPGGTDITLEIEDRDFETDVEIKQGTMGNLPAGEIWCAPVEDKANGIIVCDGSIGDIGNVVKPLKIEIRDGRIVALESDNRELVDEVKELTSVDEMAAVIGELGIGLNPKARLTGNLLEDEKAGKTAHIAFGNNENMPNGKNHSKTHRDFLFYNPTFKVEYKDGSSKLVINKGEVI